MANSRSMDWNRYRRVLAAGGALVVAGPAGAASADAVDGTVNPAGAIRLVGRSLEFTKPGKANAKTFQVTEPFYTRTFNASSTNCGRGARAIAAFTPEATAGPTGTFTVTPLNPGTCSITVSDDGSGSIRITVDVKAAATGAAASDAASPAPPPR